VADLVANFDDSLFTSVLANDSHVIITYCLTVMIARTALDLDVMIVRSSLGVTTETFLIDMLKMCIIFFTMYILTLSVAYTQLRFLKIKVK